MLNKPDILQKDNLLLQTLYRTDPKAVLKIWIFYHLTDLEDLFLDMFLNIVKQAIAEYLKQYLEPVRTHSSIYYICVCYYQNLILHKDRVNNFPFFDDDKPNDHIDHS